jgi:hypothetical protein
MQAVLIGYGLIIILYLIFIGWFCRGGVATWRLPTRSWSKEFEKGDNMVDSTILLGGVSLVFKENGDVYQGRRKLPKKEILFLKSAFIKASNTLGPKYRIGERVGVLSDSSRHFNIGDILKIEDASPLDLMCGCRTYFYRFEESSHVLYENEIKLLGETPNLSYEEGELVEHISCEGVVKILQKDIKLRNGEVYSLVYNIQNGTTSFVPETDLRKKALKNRPCHVLYESASMKLLLQEKEV